MNWKALNEAYPQAFLEWVKTFQPLAEYVTEINEVLVVKIKDWMLRRFETNQPSFWQLPEYFDALGIHVDAYRVDEAARVLREFAGLETKHGYSVMVKSPTVWEGVTYPTRREALEAGIMKAFEIREEQLKQKVLP